MVNEVNYLSIIPNWYYTIVNVKRNCYSQKLIKKRRQKSHNYKKQLIQWYLCYLSIILHWHHDLSNCYAVIVIAKS